MPSENFRPLMKVLPKEALEERFNESIPVYLRTSDLSFILGYKDDSGLRYFCDTYNLTRYRYPIRNTTAYYGKDLVIKYLNLSGESYSIKTEEHEDTIENATEAIDVATDDKERFLIVHREKEVRLSMNENSREAIILYNDLERMLWRQPSKKIFEDYPCFKLLFLNIYTRKPDFSKLKLPEKFLLDKNISTVSTLNKFVNNTEQQLNILLEAYSRPYPRKEVPKSLDKLQFNADGKCNISEDILEENPDLKAIIELIFKFMDFDFDPLYNLCNTIDHFSE